MVLFKIYDENTAYHSVFFSAVAELCSCRSKNFSASHSALPGMGWGCTKTWEEIEVGQLTQTHPKDVPYHMASDWAIKLEELVGKLLLLGERLHRSDHDEQLHSTTLVLYILQLLLLLFVFLSFSVLLNCLCVNSCVSLSLLLFSPPSCWWWK